MVHLPGLIADLALILITGAVITLLFRRIKQPLVLGYIIAGFLIGPYLSLTPTVADTANIKVLADIGVIFLLFSLGLEFSFKKLRGVSGEASVTAFTEIIFIIITGYFLGKLMGWSEIDSMFLGGMLASSSTTIIIKAFDELGLKTRRYAHVVFGVLIVEDIVVILLMVLLSTVAVTKQFEGTEMLLTVAKLLFFIVLWFVAGIFLIPTLLKKAKKLFDDETLLILSIGLCLGMVVLATQVGFSAELGAFIMGSILAETTSAEKIEHLIKPVKNMFGAVFFVSVGMLIDPQAIIDYRWPVLWITLLVLFGKFFSTTAGALVSGQPLKQSVQAGMSMAQVGEFAFIVASLGLSLKVTSDFLFPIAVGVSAITTFTTPYMIRYSESFYKVIEATLPGKWKNILAKYSVGAQNIAEISDWKKVLRADIINVVIFSVIIIGFILLITQYIVPKLSYYGWKQIMIVSISLVILAPFLWALAFRRTDRQSYAQVWQKTSRRAPLIILESSRVGLAIFYIGFLFDRLFSPQVALIGAVISCILLALLSKKIKIFYGKIEMRFLTNFNEREAQNNDSKEILTPWDSHITTFELSPQSPFVGKTLEASEIREKFGVNIAAIQRGDYVINVPTREANLYPNDKLSVIGTDEQLEKFKSYMESCLKNTTIPETHQNVSLHHFTIDENSILTGKNIRESRIRERTRGIVVAIERNEERILNPESNFKFKVNDKVWLVGNEKRMQLLIKELSGRDIM